jgi:hypothetical protein
MAYTCQWFEWPQHKKQIHTDHRPHFARCLSGAVISGGVTLDPDGWGPVPASDPVYSRIPAKTRSTTLRISIPEAIASAHIDARGSSVVSGAAVLSCDGVGPIDLASWPSNGSWAHTGVASGANGFVYPDDAPVLDVGVGGVSPNATGLWVAGFFVYDWFDARLPVTRVDTSNRASLESHRISRLIPMTVDMVRAHVVEESVRVWMCGCVDVWVGEMGYLFHVHRECLSFVRALKVTRLLMLSFLLPK